MSDSHPNKLIGVLAPNNVVREAFVTGLEQANPTLDNGKPSIQTYANGQDVELDFGCGGIMVVNAQSSKGLEFETAILADIDCHLPKDRHTLMSRFYVMVSRAREQVILLRTGAKCPVVEGILPISPTVLVRS